MHRLAPHLPPKFLLECITLIQGKLEAPLNLGLGQARRHGLGVFGGDGGAQHDRVAGLELGGQALLAPHNVVDLCRSHHTNDVQGGHPRQLRRTRRRPGTQGLQALGFVGIEVADMDHHAFGEQVARHAAAHIAHADDGHRGQGQRHDWTSCLERATDIKMPMPKPKVTMAVPP